MKRTKLLEQILSGRADANISYIDLVALLRDLQFQERVKGSHHIFSRSGIVEILNLQPKGSKTKPYQVKQVRQLIVKYRLGEDL